MKKKIPLLILTPLVFSCTMQTGKTKTISEKIDNLWLDSLIKQSDSNYTKPYKRTDFVTATFYINKKDSSVCQVMKDSASAVRQIIISKKDVRTFFAQYYSNGQLQAHLTLDEFGQYNGAATNYYINGSIQSNGNYLHGLKQSQWKNFNEKGNLISLEEYDTNGQLFKTIKQ